MGLQPIELQAAVKLTANIRFNLLYEIRGKKYFAPGLIHYI
jgi:hypothetical protein